MEKTTLSTKDKILDVALDLFSSRGYTAVSIRDISEKVGIKESSIYYHFTNKEAIWNELFTNVQQMIAVMKDSFYSKLKLVTDVTMEGFVKSADNYLLHFLLDPAVFKTIRMLSIEKYANPDARQTYEEFMYTFPLSHHEKIFSFLISHSLIAPDCK